MPPIIYVAKNSAIKRLKVPHYKNITEIQINCYLKVGTKNKFENNEALPVNSGHQAYIYSKGFKDLI